MIIKKPTSITVCESPAERKCYKYINTIAMKYHLQLTCQEKFGSQGGGYVTKTNYLASIGRRYTEEQERQDNYYGNTWESSAWGSELYRADFVLRGDGFNLVIEIDGKEFHLDKVKESIRDKYFVESMCFDILHIPAKIALFDPHKVYSLIIDKLNSITESEDYTLERLV